MYTKKGNLALIVLGIFLFQSSFCQENYLPGYIVTLKGDSIQGFIDYRNWANNPGKVSFKDKIDGEQTVYEPLDIQSFEVDNERYVGARVETETSVDLIHELTTNRELQIELATTFLQTIIQGEKSLYYYQISGSKKKNFYILQNGKFELLIMKRYLVGDKVTKSLSINRKYLKQLEDYLGDCPSVQMKLRDTKYERKSIKKLFYAYYDCTQTEAEFQKKIEKMSIEVGVLAGMTLTSLEFEGEFDFIYLRSVDYPPSQNFSAGLFLDLILPRNQRKMSIYNELFFTDYNTKGRYDDFENENIYEFYFTEFGYSYIKVNNMFRYKYPIKDLFMYVNIGISNGWAIREKNKLIEEEKFYFTERITETVALEGARKYEQGYILGLGAKFKKYSFDIRYERANGISTYGNLRSIVRRYYFLLGYQF